MNYHIINEKKLIVFWSPKCGVTSIIEMIMHLESGEDHSNTAQDHLTHETYFSKFRPNMINRNKTKSYDYSDYAKVLFIRNPFHRVASCFYDKYVDQTSPTPEDVPTINNFYQFSQLLAKTNLKKDNMEGVVDYDHFKPATEGGGWDLYCELGKPKFDYVFETPPTALPEGKIVQRYDNVEKIYKLINNVPTYESIKHLYFGTTHSHDSWKQGNFSPLKKNHNSVYETIQNLRKYLNRENCRTIPYMNFYNDQMKSMFRNIYKKEFDFYKTLGFDY